MIAPNTGTRLTNTPRFLSLYPDIGVDITIDAAIVDIVAERYDAGIRPQENLAQDIIAVRISKAIPRVVVAAPSYISRCGTPKNAAGPGTAPLHSPLHERGLHSMALLHQRPHGGASYRGTSDRQ